MNSIISKKITLITFFITSFILLSTFCEIALSHPHVFIVQRIKIVFDDNGLAGFNIQWNFDDMFASMIAGDYDKNKNGTLEKNEVELIKKEAFSYLANYNYFTFIKNGKKPFTIKFIQNFSAILNNNKLRYNFFIPFHVTAANNFKDVTVAVYDPSYYTAIFFSAKNPVTLDNSEAFEVKTSIKEDKSTSIYYDMINPWALFLNFRIK
ncbi:MAG: DUF1007 family protein [Desulfosarcina sp.]|nr:DUF1007 family protein [Desulfobacterales bacterium]